ncbi:MAG TPA: hypothetical protein IAC05_08885 [Candidatus Coprenecus stercorigallinarum]|nr:hypothetical protein [Candidatus Coprenecus stercorigallinarum]
MAVEVAARIARVDVVSAVRTDVESCGRATSTVSRTSRSTISVRTCVTVSRCTG